MKGNTDINSAIGAATAQKNYDFEQWAKSRRAKNKVATYYVCVVDKGGKSCLCPSVNYHRSRSELIRFNRHVTNEDMRDLLKAMAKTRIAPKVVGVWHDENDEGLNTIIAGDSLGFAR